MDPWTAFLSSIDVLDLGATGLLGVTVVLILTGRIEPRSHAQMWRDAYLKEQAAGREKDKQISLLVRSTTVSARVLDALPLVAGGESDAEETISDDRRRRPGRS